METNYIYIFIGVVAFIGGLILGIQTVKFFSDELIYKLENSLEQQLKINEQISEKALEQLITQINLKIDIVEKINTALKNTFDNLKFIITKVESLTKMCNNREELEFEIIKLKKIVQRMERKR